MEKYGFIYIWWDRKHKRYYIGRHWGTKDDGYICSSRWMRQSYKKRPQDFKRRIISRIINDKQKLIVEEQKWLNMIKHTEVGTKYYNKTLKADTPSMCGHKHSDAAKLKIGEGNRNKIRSETFKEAARLRQLGKKRSEEVKSKMRGKVPWNIGKTYSHNIEKWWSKGKTWEELYGAEKAAEMKTQHRMRLLGKPNINRGKKLKD